MYQAQGNPDRLENERSYSLASGKTCKNVAIFFKKLEDQMPGGVVSYSSWSEDTVEGSVADESCMTRCRQTLRIGKRKRMKRDLGRVLDLGGTAEAAEAAEHSSKLHNETEHESTIADLEQERHKRDTNIHNKPC